mmetsp:Transcript_3828/g.14917  ORF Transcript_3828/g.14917 Transcript_3828/m.14917 type:complete len:269 (-) Transcript_3828:1344-2150(-)
MIAAAAPRRTARRRRMTSSRIASTFHACSGTRAGGRMRSASRTRISTDGSANSTSVPKRWRMAASCRPSRRATAWDSSMRPTSSSARWTSQRRRGKATSRRSTPATTRTARWPSNSSSTAGPPATSPPSKGRQRLNLSAEIGTSSRALSRTARATTGCASQTPSCAGTRGSRRLANTSRRYAARSRRAMTSATADEAPAATAAIFKSCPFFQWTVRLAQTHSHPSLAVGASSVLRAVEAVDGFGPFTCFGDVNVYHGERSSGPEEPIR